VTSTEPAGAPVPGGGQEPLDRVLTLPNALSALRLVLVPVFFWLVLTRRDGWALAVLMISGFTDYLDGELARRWNQVSRLGQLLDPVADRLYILATLVGLAWRGVVPWWLLALIVGRDVLLAFTIPALARYGYGPIPVHFLGKAATFCLLYAFPLLLLAQIGGPVAEFSLVLGWAFAWWGTGLYWWAGWLYLRQVREVLEGARTGESAGAARPAGVPGADPAGGLDVKP
jgi:cardiolipin synthase